MRIIEYKYPSVGTVCGPAAACLGFFDGVHLGHRALIGDTVRLAAERDIESMVFTFPSESLGLKSDIPRIYPTGEKLGIFEELGIDIVVLCDFSSVSSLSADEFVSHVLCRDLGVRVALSGEDFRFGHRASAGSTELIALMKEHGGEGVAHVMERCSLPEGSVEISATLIRGYLSRGDVRTAAALLGAPYRITAPVVGGLGMGRGYGYPTLNTDIGSSPIRHGVYHTEVKIGGKSYTGLTNVGTCPTFGARAAHAESFLLDFSGDAYGCDARISFIDFIRDERTFGSPEELRREIEKNVKDLLGRKSGNG